MTLYYERYADAGGREIVFVPGWCCDHTAFAPQVEHFRAAHSVTVLSLRGCGRSEVPPDGYDIPTLADDVAALCAEVGIEKPIVIGHSLGGMIAVELGARHPSLPAALVGVDPGPLNKTDAAHEAFSDFAIALGGPDGEAARREWVEDTPGPTIDAALGAAIIETMCAVPLPIARAMIEGVVVWDGAEAMKRCSAPLLVLRAAAAPGASNDPARLQPLKPDTYFGLTVGAGHFNHLEVPEQVNAMIERFLELALPA